MSPQAVVEGVTLSALKSLIDFFYGCWIYKEQRPMPIYEYRCQHCGRKNEFITFRVSEPVPTVCQYCNSELIQKIPSRVRVRLSEETRLERLADPARLGGLDENDPKSMAKWMKSMTHEMGDELGEDMDVDDMIEEAMEEETKGPSGGAEGVTDDEF
jgi:putative FmdB family regulatory protein